MDYENYLFFDIEVFKHNCLVVFKNYDGNTVKIFSNSLNGFGKYIDKGIDVELGFKNLEDYVKNKTLVGYNNHYYDDRIMKMIMWGTNTLKDKKVQQILIKGANDKIIQNKPLGWLKYVNDLPYTSIDCFQQIDVSRPSLKKVEGNMGVSIVESSVPFDIDRPLSPEENLETLKYCEYDVLNTVKIFKMRKEYFQSKQSVIEMLDDEHIKKKAVKWNTTSIVGQLLKPKRRVPIYRILPSKHTLSYVNDEVREMWSQLYRTLDYKFDKKKVIINEFNNDLEFSWGGFHGAPKGFLMIKNIKLADVGSMYPSILINLMGLGDSTEKYKKILEYRLMLKHQGKKEEQAPYKLILKNWG